MLKTLVKASGIIAGLALSSMAYAVGMGGINVTSALGQPLAVEIELVSVDKAEKPGLSARLASPDAFKGAGIDYPYSLPKLKFQIENRADGEPYLKVTTKEAVNDPFLSLLVELDWASGKLLREYTFLLDPPDYQAVQPKAEAVQPIEPSVAPVQPQAPLKVEAVAPQTEKTPMRAVAPMDRKALASAKPVTANNVASGSIKVKSGDTLGKIAAQIKEPDVTLEQMLVALYRANAAQFDGKNMNRLRAGKILRRPDAAELQNLSNKEAIREIRTQAADWHAYRQKLAAASSGTSDQAAQQEVSGKISTSVADQMPAAKQSAKEVLKLSKGEAPGDKAVASGNVQAMQDKIHALEEEAIARNKALQDSNDRIALLEKNIKEMQHLIDLKGLPAVAAPPAVTAPVPAKAETPPAPPVVAPASQVVVAGASQAVAASAPQPAKPVAKPKPKAAPKVVPPPPSMLDEIMGEPLYLAGAAAVVLALGGLGLIAVRRSKGGKIQKGAPGALQPGEITGSHIAEPVTPSPETGDFTQVADVDEVAADRDGESAEDVDPISEAELFLNFGRDAQAEEVLKEALSRDPNNRQVQLKLLGIYANRKDVNAFSSIARRVKDSGDADAWEQTAGMGRKIDPTNPMYGGVDEEVVTGETAAAAEAVETEETASAVTDFSLDEGKSEAPAALDFDLGFGAAEAEAEPLSEPVEPEQATGMESTTILSQEDIRAAQEAPMDFDITSSHQNIPALDIGQPEPGPAAKDEAALDFDITSTNPAMQAAPESAALDATTEEKGETALNLDDLIFDVTATHPSMPALEPEVVEESKAKDIGLGDISLNLDGIGTEQSAAPAAGGGSKDEHWHEVATKLDLAKAYQEMGDNEGAREILEEVLRDGDDQQREAAQALIEQLSA
ncbi:MAG: hypothetical protein GC139_05365 [Sideroxydans sp.]|nr:hypothetical protein [Sideroxydans sp.]